MKKLLAILSIALLLMGCSNTAKPTDQKPNDNNNSENTPSSEPVNESTPEPASELTLGSTFSFDGFEITLYDTIEWDVLSNQFSDKDGSDVFLIPFHVKNNTEETGMLNPFYVKYFGSTGVSIDDISTYFDGSFGFSSDELRPGAEYDSKFALLYDGDGDYYIEFESFSEHLEVKIPVTK